jgi:hypothetical protein
MNTDLRADFEMLRVLTRAFGPGRNIKVKYSFFWIFLDFLTPIIPPGKGTYNCVKDNTKRQGMSTIYLLIIAKKTLR